MIPLLIWVSDRSEIRVYAAVDLQGGDYTRVVAVHEKYTVHMNGGRDNDALISQTITGILWRARSRPQDRNQ